MPRLVWVVALLAVLLGFSERAHAQSCGPFPTVLPVSLSGTVTYVGAQPQNLSASFSHDRSQLAQCPASRVDQQVGQPGCGTGQMPLGRLLAEALLVAADRQVGLFELSCGNLSGTFTLGNPPFAQISGSFSLRYSAAGPTAMTLNVTVPTGPGFDGLFTGDAVLNEAIKGAGPGAASGTGSLQVSTGAGTGSMVLAVSYQIVGNRSAVLVSAPHVKQTLDYACTTGTLTSQLCPIGVATPASSWLPLLALGLLLGGLGLRVLARLGHG